ncbi:MAG: AAA-like domain-containing protein, partial [Leptospirales bacterium]|nr:AAA-like domain-containing protein [Leptospirales bacterium]
RQCGKTTTLSLLEKTLSTEYTVISISFEGVSDSMFETEERFCQGLLNKCAKELKRLRLPEADKWENNSIVKFDLLDDFLTDICCDKKYVLMIDEIDKSSNNLIFLKFLGILRDKYLRRSQRKDFSFQSVILAGVYDIKNLKIKMIQAGTHQLQDGEQRINSPWNIASNFDIDMSLSEKEIASMLVEYEKDRNTGMDIETVSKEIRTYTNGYPYLVSRICQAIEDELDKDWTANGVERAIKLMILENSTLIDDIFKNLNNNKDLDNLMFNIVALGKKYTHSHGIPAMDLGLTFGFLIKQGDNVAIGNKFFEILLYRFFTTRLELERDISRMTVPSDVISGDKLNMQMLIEKFAHHYYEIYKKSLKKFVEEECRILFLTFLQPLINGGGFYHVESETRDAQRMDVVVDYGTDQFIVELKLWYGDAKHEKALDQLVGYLDRKNKDTGYLLTFDFRKEENTGKPKAQWVEYKGKKIFDMMVGA